MDKRQEKIRQAVKDYYSAFASRVQAAEEWAARSCCLDSVCSCAAEQAASLYGEDLLADLPLDVSALSLGCGDPVTMAALQPGETVLDLGCGPGLDCFLAARQVGEMGHVIGVDMTPEMLGRANAKKAKLGLRNVEFRQGLIEEVPVEDNSVDVVMSNCVINLSPDKEAVFREVFRVLKLGGRIAISDIVSDGEFSPELRADLRRWAGCVSGAIHAELYTQMLRQVGFVEVQIADKADADGIVETVPGAPRLFSARITARKPA